MTRRCRRLVGGTIWNQEMNRLHRALDELRRLLAEGIGELERRPVSARGLAMLLGKAALALNEAAAALRELNVIVQGNE